MCSLGRRFFKAKPFRMTLYCEAVTLGKRFFLPAVVRMTSFCNFFPAAKKLPRKVARWLSGIPASRFARRRGLRNSLRSNSPRPISVFSLAPGSPIKAGIFPLRHYRPLRVRVVASCHSEYMRGIPYYHFVGDSSFRLRYVQNDSVSGGDSPTRNLYVISNESERSHTKCSLGRRFFKAKPFRMTLRRKSFNTLQGILPPCSRQNDITW